MAHRYRCGECGFSTRWSTESEAGDLAAAHYADHHPGLPLGGIVQINEKNPRTLGCLPMIGIMLLLLLIIASCRR
ncbi:hypothetical protein AB0M42_07740 [Streptomyces sp. NPDC051784]|uniref:hypothetical protein n=1 Tax=Streptomyces sp. NPDC051784 TaxID=3155805 RepID=UPI003448A363